MAKSSSAPDTIVQEAKDRHKRTMDWEAEARKRFIADRKFANGDSDNMWQWDDRIAGDRIRDNRPMLTINDLQQHNLQIINDAKKNKPEIRIRPVGDGATYKSAQVFQSVARHIEYISNAQTVYDRATTFQVEGGWGYWRVVTDYADSESLDQEIFLRPVKDTLSVLMDPDINEADGSDARFCIIFDDVPTDKFTAKFPQYKDAVPTQTLNNGDDWLNEDHVRIAEYYRRLEKKDQLVSWVGDDGERQQAKASKLGKEVVAQLEADDTTEFRSRDITEDVIEWFKIVGDKIVEKTIWPGRYIPVVRVIGVETVIDGKLDRKGHTRPMKDPQRQYNYWSSSAAEQVALQGKNPYVGSLRAIEGLTNYWENANTENFSILPFNDLDDDGKKIDKPERTQPPVMAPAYIQGMQIARQELMLASGQYEANMGAQGNERSGTAIEARQRQGDTATYHFIDNLAVAIRFTGRILIDLIPKIYDTPRIIRLLASDGSVDMDSEPVHIDPQAKQAYVEQVNEEQQVVKRIFNPNVGRYDVQADIGPDFATRRQETFNALMQLVQEDSALLPLVGDILFRAADFAMADEVAERLKNMVPPQALGGPSPEQQQAQQTIQQLQSALQSSVEALADSKKRESVDGYKAETDRLKLGTDIDPLALVPIIRQAVEQALGMPLPSGIPVVGQATIPDQPAEQEAA